MNCVMWNDQNGEVLRFTTTSWVHSSDTRDPFGVNGPLPSGTYIIKFGQSGKFGPRTPSVSDVDSPPGCFTTPEGTPRSDVRIHAGSYSKGCVTIPRGENVVEALKRYADATGGIWLTIEDIEPQL